MHQALYRKWRPRNFDEVSGQDHITSILKYECQTGKFSHAYLFCGSRGTGKTSCAKILAKAVNCLHPTSAGPCGECAACRSVDVGSATDVLEMDAASNNGVDDIRDIRDEVIYAPSELKYRVYIIDEVHMLSQSAFNALLKTLEEPPSHVIFILATTELHKLPSTIISRCQRFDFRRISTDDLVARLHRIASAEDITLDDDAARLIARHAQGGMRDAISLLELCAGSRAPVTPALVADTIGTTGREGLFKVARAILDKKYDTLFETIDEMARSSRDIAVFWPEVIGLYRDMLVLRTVKSGNAARYLDLTDSEYAAMSELASRFTKETILHQCGLLEDALFTMQKAYAVKRTVAEITLMRLCDPALDSSTESILSRLSRLEEQAITGAPLPVETVKVESTPSVNEKAQAAAQVQPQSPVTKPTVKATEVPVASTPRETPPIPAVKADNTRVLRPLRVWSEVIDRVKDTSPMAASFLRQAKAYTVEGGEGIVIKFTGEFECSMIRSRDAMEAVRKALSVCLGRAVPTDLITTEVIGQVSESSPIDEIIESLGED